MTKSSVKSHRARDKASQTKGLFDLVTATDFISKLLPSGSTTLKILILIKIPRFVREKFILKAGS